MILVVLTATGCGVNRLPQATIDELASLEYPADAEYGDDLDIVVVRSGRSLELANREPSAFADKQLWLNRQYVTFIDRIAIGTGNAVDLDGCINQYQESYPRNQFLHPDRGKPLVLAELYDPTTGLKNRLLVQPAE